MTPTPTPTPAPATAARPVFGKNVLSVLSVFAGIILLLVLLAAFAVAKTGLIDVPFFSRLYHGPQPSRVVESQPISADAFRVLVSGRILAQARTGAKPPYRFSLSEQELTGGLLSVVNQALRTERWKAENVQLAVTQDFVEITGRLVRDEMHADMRVRFMPIIENGGMRFEPIDIRFGDYPIHPNLAHSLAGTLFSRDLGTWAITFGDVRLESVTLEDGRITLTTSVQ